MTVRYYNIIVLVTVISIWAWAYISVNTKDPEEWMFYLKVFTYLVNIENNIVTTIIGAEDIIHLFDSQSSILTASVCISKHRKGKWALSHYLKSSIITLRVNTSRQSSHFSRTDSFSLEMINKVEFMAGNLQFLQVVLLQGSSSADKEGNNKEEKLHLQEHWTRNCDDTTCIRCFYTLYWIHTYISDVMLTF